MELNTETILKGILCIVIIISLVFCIVYFRKRHKTSKELVNLLNTSNQHPSEVFRTFARNKNITCDYYEEGSIKYGDVNNRYVRVKLGRKLFEFLKRKEEGVWKAYSTGRMV